jgi:hypothetical protein
VCGVFLCLLKYFWWLFDILSAPRMMHLFNKTFYRFLFAFMVVVTITLILILVVGSRAT